MFSQISDGELDDFVTSAQQSHPNIGIRMVKGLLQSKGHRVQKERIRQSLLRTDPIGVMQRWSVAVRRRRYNVHSPLALWHIDGHHKLIRYISELPSTLGLLIDQKKKINNNNINGCN